MWVLVVDMAGKVVLLHEGLPTFSTGEGERRGLTALGVGGGCGIQWGSNVTFLRMPVEGKGANLMCWLCTTCNQITQIMVLY